MSDEWSDERRRGYGIGMKRGAAKAEVKELARNVERLERELSEVRRFGKTRREKLDRAILICAVAVAVLIAKIVDLFFYGVK